MEKLRMTLACGNYDRTSALADGTIQPEGLEVDFVSPGTVDLFRRMLHHAEFDASELSLSNYTMGLARGDRRFIAIPIFPYRAFRHSMVWVSADSGIREPRDLVGKRMGIPEYAVTALLFLRGLLKHEYGVLPENIRWVRQLEERVALNLPPNVDLVDVRPGQTLDCMLEEGELDAVATFTPPWEFERGSSRVRRLFPDARQVEVDYYRRTRIFPIMHLIAIRRDFYERNRWVATSLARAFQAAKEHCYERMQSVSPMYSLTPWLRLDIVDTWRIFDGEPYPYGVQRNLPTLEAATLYSYEQHLSERKVAVEELFAPETLDMFATAP